MPEGHLLSTSFHFLGAAGFEMKGPNHRILVDPFLTGNPAAPLAAEEVEPPDVILVTHAAFDHLGDPAQIARRTGAPVVCGGYVRWLLIDDGVPSAQIQATVWGGVVKVNGVVVRPVECHHWSMSVRPNGQVITGTPLAFIVEPEPGIPVYHYGDTSYFDMRFIGDLSGPRVGLIGCSQPYELVEPEPHAGEELTGEMAPAEAARAAEMLGVDVAVACHYFTHNADTNKFLPAVGKHDSTGRRRALAPLPGQEFIVERDASGRVGVAESVALRVALPDRRGAAG